MKPPFCQTIEIHMEDSQANISGNMKRAICRLLEFNEQCEPSEAANVFSIRERESDSGNIKIRLLILDRVENAETEDPSGYSGYQSFLKVVSALKIKVYQEP